MRNFPTRVLRQTGLTADQQISCHQLLLSFWRILMAYQALLVLEQISDLQLEIPELGLAAVRNGGGRLLGYWGCIGLSFVPSLRTWLFPLAFMLLGYEFWLQIPGGANHTFLCLVSLLFATGGLFLAGQAERSSPAKEGLAEQYCRDSICGIRWLVVYVMLWSGLNKLLYGTYFRGEFFAAMLHRDPRFAEFFARLIPAAELQEIIDSPQGPYQFRSLLPIVGANLIYVSEIAAGLLLLIPRLVYVGVVLTFGILVGIEVVAVELVFGGLMVILLQLYFPLRFRTVGRWTGWLITLSLTVYHGLQIIGVGPNWGIY